MEKALISLGVGTPLHLNREGWACLAFPNTLGELVSAHPSPTISPNSPLSSEILHPRPHSLTLRYEHS